MIVEVLPGYVGTARNAAEHFDAWHRGLPRSWESRHLRDALPGQDPAQNII